MKAPPEKHLRKAVIFDLDGTLTRPMLDFEAIRREIGIASGPILEALACMPLADRRRGESVLERHERAAAEDSTLHAGALEVIGALRAGGFPVAILTRNARRWVDIVIARHGLIVDLVRTREDGPTKPSAEPVLAICSALGADPAWSWMVGDFKFDLEAGRAAGSRTVLMIGNGAVPEYASEADHVIRELHELLPLILADHSAPTNLSSA